MNQLSDQERLKQNQQEADDVFEAARQISMITHPNSIKAKQLRAEAVSRYPEHLQNRIRTQIIINFSKKEYEDSPTS